MALGLEPERAGRRAARSLDRRQRRPRGVDEHRRPRSTGCSAATASSAARIAAATGAALALKGTGSVAVAYFGDGTANQAYFFECLNFAKVLTLPLVFVCENNGYGEYTPMADVTAGDDHRPGEDDGDPGDRRRRHGRLGHARRGAGGDRARPRRRGPDRSSRPARTASSATPAAIRASTGPRASSRSGRRAIRSCSRESASRASSASPTTS